MGQSWPLFHLFLSFSHSNINSNFNYTSWKKRSWCFGDLNPGPLDGRRRWNHGAMEAAQIRYSNCYYYYQCWPTMQYRYQANILFMRSMLDVETWSWKYKRSQVILIYVTKCLVYPMTVPPIGKTLQYL